MHDHLINPPIFLKDYTLDEVYKELYEQYNGKLSKNGKKIGRPRNKIYNIHVGRVGLDFEAGSMSYVHLPSGMPYSIS